MPPSPPITRCPTLHVLSEYVSGRLPEADAESLMAHLERCIYCQRHVDELVQQEDSLLNAVRHGGLPEASSGDDDGLRSLVDRACSDTRMEANQRTTREESIALDVFAVCLRKSRLLPDKEIDSLLESIEPSDTDAFARELLRRKLLTPFQSKALKRGRYKGLVLGNYIVLEKLGEGGMGHVFKARHCRMGRIVCLKVMHSAGRKSPEMVERFKRETLAVASLNHPNIVVAHDADEADGIPFLVMEYIEGHDLARYVKQNGPLAPMKAVSLVQQVATALAYAHQQGVVHRDIKPHNLLLDKAGSVKILDMGLARFDSYLSDNPDASTHAAMTNSGVVMGTVDYMSPEQALNCRHADARSDIYSLGCTLHFLLTGQPVFDGQTIMERLVAHREHAVPWLGSVVNEASPELDAVFHKMVAKDADERYQSMPELIDDLAALRSGGMPKAAMQISDVAAAPRTRKKQLPYFWTAVAISAAFVIGIACAVAGNQWMNDFFAPPDDAQVAENSLSSSGPISAAPGEKPKSDEPARHPNTRAAGGRGRAVVVVPHAYFYEDHYSSLTSALQRRGVEVVVASSQTGMARPKHGKITPVQVDATVNQCESKNFDAIFFIDGNRWEFIDEHGDCNSDTQQLIQGAIESGSPVASVGGAVYVVRGAGMCSDCSLQKMKDVEVRSPNNGQSGSFLAIANSQQSDTLVHLIFDKGGMADSLK